MAEIIDLDRSYVEQALAEAFDLGRPAFLKKYDLKNERVGFLVYRGKRFDAFPVFLVALGMAGDFFAQLRIVPPDKNSVFKWLEENDFPISQDNNWTQEELTLIINDYFDMMVQERVGATFNKKEHNRNLSEKLDGRTPASIELKHQNISAALQKMNLGWIKGYKPRGHYQEQLVQTIKDYFEKNQLEKSRPVENFLPGDEIIGSLEEVFPENPKPKSRKEKSSQPKFQPIKKDFEEQSSEQRKLGSGGEELVLVFERQRLKSLGLSDLADRIRWVSKEDGDGAGYDIHSFDTNGSSLFIEVKTTRGGIDSPFFLSDNEHLFLSQKDNSVIYRVFNFGRNPKFYKIKGPIPPDCLTPVLYRVSRPISQTSFPKEMSIGGVVEPFRRLQPNESVPYQNCVPLLTLEAAAGGFSDEQIIEHADWVTWDGIKPSKRFFVAKVIGESMNKRIPNGSWCLWEFNPGGSRNGFIVLAQHRVIQDPEYGGNYTVKEYHSEKAFSDDGTWKHSKITLKPLSLDSGYEAIELYADSEGISDDAVSLNIVAKYVKTL